MTTYLMNTTMVPCPGMWQVTLVDSDRRLALEQVVVEDLYQAVVAGEERRLRPEVVSAIGHADTTSLINRLLEDLPGMDGGFEPVITNRMVVEPVAGDRFVCIKLRGRIPEGVLLTEEQIEQIGYEWVRMELLSTPEA